MGGAVEFYVKIMNGKIKTNSRTGRFILLFTNPYLNDFDLEVDDALDKVLTEIWKLVEASAFAVKLN